MSFEPWSLMGSLIFSGIGFIAFRYGRSTANFQLVALGGALMAYSYFTPTALLTWGVGAALTAAAWFSRDAS